MTVPRRTLQARAAAPAIPFTKGQLNELSDRRARAIVEMLMPKAKATGWSSSTLKRGLIEGRRKKSAVTWP